MDCGMKVLTEVIDEDRGPGLEVRAFRAQRCEALRRDQFAFEDVLLAYTHAALEREQLCKTDVHGADRVRVVVDQAERNELALALDLDLFPELAPRGADERIRDRVFGVDVAPDPDRELAMQPSFASLLQTAHQKDLPRLPAHNRVGDHLLQRRRALRVSPLDEEAVGEHGLLEGLAPERAPEGDE